MIFEDLVLEKYKDHVTYEILKPIYEWLKGLKFSRINKFRLISDDDAATTQPPEIYIVIGCINDNVTGIISYLEDTAEIEIHHWTMEKASMIPISDPNMFKLCKAGLAELEVMIAAGDIRGEWPSELKIFGHHDEK